MKLERIWAVDMLTLCHWNGTTPFPLVYHLFTAVQQNLIHTYVHLFTRIFTQLPFPISVRYGRFLFIALHMRTSTQDRGYVLILSVLSSAHRGVDHNF